MSDLGESGMGKNAYHATVESGMGWYLGMIPGEKKKKRELFISIK